MIAVSIQSDGRTTLAIRGLERLPRVLDNALAAGLQRGLEYARSIAQTEYLSGPRPAKLDVVTTRLRNSISQRVKVNPGGAGIVGTIGSNVKYAAYHEFGFHGLVNVAAHARIASVISSAGGIATEVRRVIKDKAGNIIGFKETRSKALKRLPASEFIVSSQSVPTHSRKVDYAGRPFIAPALKQAEPIILEELRKALGAALPPSTQ